MDFTAGVILLVILMPFLLFVALGCCLSYRGQVFFLQQRVGRNSEIFRIRKFRTMKDGKDKFGNFLPDEQRITRFGAFLRRYSIDELPQIIHVVTGQMSFIGPRPLIPEQTSDCTPSERQRHLIRPGITGLAQVSGRNEIPFHSRFRYDVWYMKHISFTMDFYIFSQTFGTIFRKQF